ncbi:MAG: hypothetical protein RLZZ422_1495 [Pseudomonadota bacterium]|jgi:hypothetical protein
MKSIVVFGLVFSIVFSALAWADAPVTHKHGGRSHTHVLPSTGVNHSHGSPQRPTPQPATSSGWVYITTSDGYNPVSFYGKAGSLQRTTSHYSIISKSHNPLTKGIVISREIVPISNCNNGVGVLKAYDLSGNLVQQNDFAFGSGNVASLIAETICIAGASLR